MDKAKLAAAIDAAWERRTEISASTKGEVRDAVEPAMAVFDARGFKPEMRFEHWLAKVYGPGELNDQLSGLTGGTRYFLGTAGGETATVPTAAASIVQGLGVAKSATAIRFAPTGPYKRAAS